MIKVSVITICYNNCEGLIQTIRSVENQDYSNMEYIIIDGGSSDGTVNAIKNHEKFISYWCSEKDKGIYNAMNKGIDHMTGDWCIFMNSGDCFCDNHAISHFVSIKKDTNTAVVYGDTSLLIPPYGVVSRTYGKREGEALTGICHQSSFIRCDIMKKYHYDEKFKIAADVNFFYHLVSEGYEFVYTPRIISQFLAIDGLSSCPSLAIMNEFHRILGVKKHSIRYYKDLIRYLVKIIMESILPKELNKYLYYKRLASKYKHISQKGIVK